jgi:hypothetical protein
VGDLQRIAARLLRVALGAGVTLVGVAGPLALAGGGASRWAHLAAASGIAVVVAAPFVTLVAMAVAARRSVLVVYAAATLGCALAGILLVR